AGRPRRAAGPHGPAAAEPARPGVRAGPVARPARPAADRASGEAVVSGDALVVCTALPAGQLELARALAASVRAHRPGAEVVVALLDPADGSGEGSEPFRVVPPDGLAVPDLPRHRFLLTPAGLQSVTRPYLIGHVLDTSPARWVLAVEPGTLLTDDLRSLERLLGRHPVVSLPQPAGHGGEPGAY